MFVISLMWSTVSLVTCLVTVILRSRSKRKENELEISTVNVWQNNPQNLVLNYYLNASLNKRMNPWNVVFSYSSLLSKSCHPAVLRGHIRFQKFLGSIHSQLLITPSPGSISTILVSVGVSLTVLVIVLCSLIMDVVVFVTVNMFMFMGMICYVGVGGSMFGCTTERKNEIIASLNIFLYLISYSKRSLHYNFTTPPSPPTTPTTPNFSVLLNGRFLHFLAPDNLW